MDSAADAGIAFGKPAVVEAAMVFILTYFFGTAGILFR
jgi:hypothetical protein